jgi:hypothetical protein
VLLKYLIGVACAFRLSLGRGVSEEKIWSKIPEKMKIGDIFSVRSPYPRNEKRGIILKIHARVRGVL